MPGRRKTLAEQAADALRVPGEEAWYPAAPAACFDLALHLGMQVRLIRVRRPARITGGGPDARPAEVTFSRDLRALRKIAVSELVAKELVIREPGPVWRRFLVHPDRIEELTPVIGGSGRP